MSARRSPRWTARPCPARRGKRWPSWLSPRPLATAKGHYWRSSGAGDEQAAEILGGRHGECVAGAEQARATADVVAGPAGGTRLQARQDADSGHFRIVRAALVLQPDFVTLRADRSWLPGSGEAPMARGVTGQRRERG